MLVAGVAITIISLFALRISWGFLKKSNSNNKPQSNDAGMLPELYKKTFRNPKAILRLSLVGIVVGVILIILAS